MQRTEIAFAGTDWMSAAIVIFECNTQYSIVCVFYRKCHTTIVGVGVGQLREQPSDEMDFTTPAMMCPHPIFCAKVIRLCFYDCLLRRMR